MNIRFTFAKGEPIDAEVERGVSLAAVAEGAGITLEHTCRGHGRCGRCIVTIESGLESLMPPGEAEERVLRILKAKPNQRLACQTRVNEHRS